MEDIKKVCPFSNTRITCSKSCALYNEKKSPHCGMAATDGMVNAFGSLKESIDELTLQLMALSEAKKSAEKTSVKAKTEYFKKQASVSEWLDSISPMELPNRDTKSVYDQFKAWVAMHDYENPYAAKGFTCEVKKITGLVIAKGKAGYGIYETTPEFSKYAQKALSKG